MGEYRRLGVMRDNRAHILESLYQVFFLFFFEKQEVALSWTVSSPKDLLKSELLIPVSMT